VGDRTVPHALLAAASIVFILSPNPPSAILLVGSVALRLRWQAGELNTTDEGQAARLGLATALPLMLAGAILAETGSTGYIDGLTFATLGQVIAIPFVGLPYLLLNLGSRDECEPSPGLRS
jgi:hypothetical protein